MKMLDPSKSLVAALLVLAGIAACQDSTTGPVWVDSLRLQPDSIFIVPGETAEFTALPLDQNQNELPERAGRADWSLANPSVATLDVQDGVATVTALQPGATFVRVDQGRGTGRGQVYVEPQELSEIRVDPGGTIVLDRSGGFGSRTTVRPILIGLDGQEVAPSGYRISWRTSSTQIFIMVGLQEVITGTSISLAGRNPGQAILTLAVGDRAVSVPVIVR